MKKKIKKIIYKFFKLFYKKFYNFEELPISKLFLIFFFQKIIGINRQVPWPVHFTSFVKAHEKIQKGSKNPGDAMGGYFDGRNGIILKENVWIGPKVSIISKDHNLTKYTNYIDNNPIIIGKNSLLLAACTILPGVELAEHTVVAAGAVVTKSFSEPDTLIGGIPAKIIKKLDIYKE